MDGDTLYSIGDLARRTGLTVKTIRFYADQGIVPPTGRSPAGYRLYDIAAVARLDLVRTLRDLGLDLPTIRRVVDREVSLPQVAAAHAEALEVRIRALRLRRAVLTAVARRGSTPEEMELMHKLARLSEEERLRLIDDFLADAFQSLDTDPGFAGLMSTLTPVLPDDPEPEQVEAWVELAGLASDPAFRAAIRHLAHQHKSDRPAGERIVPDAAALAREYATPALTAGVGPGSAEAESVLADMVTHYARDRGLTDDTELRRRFLVGLEAAGDPRWERYLELLAVINGWPPPESLAPALGWCAEALRARLPA